MQHGGKKLKVVSLFSGAMGLDLGLEATGFFETIACVEKIPAFCDTIRLNRDKGRLARKDLRVFEADVCTVDPFALMDELSLEPGELDLLVGGPPCQTFSTAGRRQSVQDTRGTLLWQFLRFVEALQPKFFLMENVRGLISAAIRHRPIRDRPENGGKALADDEKPGSVINLFLSDLSAKKLNYRLDCFEVNAVNYGAPQIRERALFIGNRLGHIVEFPEPTHGPTDTSRQKKGRQVSLFEEVANPPRPLKPFRTLGDAIRDLEDPAPVVMDFSPRKKKYLSMVQAGGNWRSLPPEIAQESMGKAYFAKGGRSGWWRRLSYDLPCPTIVTMPNHSSTSLCHPEEVRALSVRECAAVQEFPRDWEFAGTPFEQYAQVGNAVPIRLGKVAGKALAKHFEQLDKHPSIGLSAPQFRSVYLQSHVRTRRWFNDGQAVLWKDGKPHSSAAYSPPRTLRRERLLLGSR